MRNKSSKRKILLSFLLAFAALVGCLAYVFRSEIELAFFALATSKEAVQDKQMENDQKTQALLEQIAVQTMRDLTEEERKLLASGELSAEDALALIQGVIPTMSAETTTVPVETTAAVSEAAFADAPKVTDPSIPETTVVIEITDIPKTVTAAPIETTIAVQTEPKMTEATAAETSAATTATTAATTTAATAATTAATTTAATAATTATTATTITTTTTAITTVATTTTTTTTVTTAETTTVATVDRSALQNRQSEIIAEIYLLRATYLNEIDALIAETKAEYIALPKEQHTLTGKLQIVEKMIPKGNELEDACDAQMEALLQELTSILKQLGSSTAIIDEIRETYDEQKLLKKTELYNEYMPKLN